ncbi:unnamed protein product [Knipowitschia caucasica]|uniref:U1-type domain-containing protein n=1 Tax=Knipowitschia caucasica TaxID=637954 RepID=A0AAV2KCZ3_KNICA
MKRPFSPSLLLTTDFPALSVQMDACNAQNLTALHPDFHQAPHGGALHTSSSSSAQHHRPKRERKHRSFTLCDVCNIQLNSAAQAQIHYNGKSHQKRLKQISNGKLREVATGRNAKKEITTFTKR